MKISANIKWAEGEENIEVDDNENDLYKVLAEKITTISIPNKVLVDCGNYGDAQYIIVKRPDSFFIKEDYNNIELNGKNDYKPIYLTCADAEKNHYKYYKIEQNGTDKILATYGRIGADAVAGSGLNAKNMMIDRTYSYPKRMYWIKFCEKKLKGYKDRTKFYLYPQKNTIKNKKEKKTNPVKSVNESSIYLFQKLKGYSRHVVETSCKSSVITEAMVKESKRLYKKLCERKTVNGFNNVLLELITVCPRWANPVSTLLAKSKDDFANIVNRESNLINSMETLIVNPNDSADYIVNSFESMGIEVFYANDKQKTEVLRHLDDGLKTKVKNIFRVINVSQKKRFDNYLSNEKISVVKQYWHGSGNENWLSIIKNGLLLNPDAQITGKMFGNGIYFAPSSNKCWKYTSYHGTYWRHGTSDTAFMGLYATAYGKPLDVYSAGRYNKTNIGGKNCVHAHAGSQLYNDEIIFYDECAMTLNYIVEFSD